MGKNNFYDNYNLVYSDTIDNYQTTFCGTASTFVFTYAAAEEPLCLVSTMVAIPPIRLEVLD